MTRHVGSWFLTLGFLGLFCGFAPAQSLPTQSFLPYWYFDPHDPASGPVLDLSTNTDLLPFTPITVSVDVTLYICGSSSRMATATVQIAPGKVTRVPASALLPNLGSTSCTDPGFEGPGWGNGEIQGSAWGSAMIQIHPGEKATDVIGVNATIKSLSPGSHIQVSDSFRQPNPAGQATVWRPNVNSRVYVAVMNPSSSTAVIANLTLNGSPQLGGSAQMLQQISVAPLQTTLVELTSQLPVGPSWIEASPVQGDGPLVSTTVVIDEVAPVSTAQAMLLFDGPTPLYSAPLTIGTGITNQIAIANPSASAVTVVPALGWTVPGNTSIPAGFTYCASENQTCSFSGVQDVAFGGNGSYKLWPGVASGSFACKTGTPATATTTIAGSLNSASTSGSVQPAAAGSPLVGYVQSDGTSHTFYLAPNQHLYHLFWSSPSTWTNQDLTVLTGSTLAAANSSLNALLDSKGVGQVFYLDSNQHVHRSSCCAWQDQDLTGSYTAAASGSPLTSFSDANGDHVVYVGTNQHLYHLNSATDAMETQDLGQVSGAVFSATGSDLTSLVDSAGNGRVYYVGVNQHIIELRLDATSATWGAIDLTAQSGSRNLAVANSRLSSFGAVGNQAVQVIYLDANQHVNDLWLNSTASTGTWSAADLTALTNGALATSGSALSSHVDGAVARIYYLGTNQHVYELKWDSAHNSLISMDIMNAAATSSTAVAGSALFSFAAADGTLDHVHYLNGNQYINDLTANTASSWSNQGVMAAALNSVPDSGTVSLNVGGFVATACFGLSTNSSCTGQPENTNSGEIAAALANAINVSGSPATAFVSGSTLTLRLAVPGPTSGTVAALSTTHDNKTLFSVASFTSQASGFVGGDFSDPAPGVAKACYISQSHPDGNPSRFKSCANENQNCAMTSPRDIAFGARGIFDLRTNLPSGTACTTATFGDPTPGVAKSCYRNTVDNLTALSTQSGPALTLPATSTGTYTLASLGLTVPTGVATVNLQVNPSDPTNPSLIAGSTLTAQSGFYVPAAMHSTLTAANTKISASFDLGVGADDTRATISAVNVTNSSVPINLVVSYTNTSGSLQQYTMPATLPGSGGMVSYDLRQLRDNQVPDANSNVLPANLTTATARIWAGVPAITGNAQTFSVSQRMVSPSDDGCGPLLDSTGDNISDDGPCFDPGFPVSFSDPCDPNSPDYSGLACFFEQGQPFRRVWNFHKVKLGLQDFGIDIPVDTPFGKYTYYEYCRPINVDCPTYPGWPRFLDILGIVVTYRSNGTQPSPGYIRDVWLVDLTPIPLFSPIIPDQICTLGFVAERLSDAPCTPPDFRRKGNPPM